MQRLPFPGPLNKDLLDTIVPGGAVEIWNGLIDRTGAVHKRPGIVLNSLPDISRGVDGLFWWESKRRFVLIGDGHLFSAMSLADDFARQNPYTASLRDGICQFADTGEWLYVCSTEGPLMLWDGANQAFNETDAVAPNDVSTIAFFKGRVYANERDTNRLWYTSTVSLTDPAAKLTWEGYVDVRLTGDPIIGLQPVGSGLIIFKRSSMEVYYYDDALASIRPVDGSARMYGLDSSRGYLLHEDRVYFLTHDKRIVRTEAGAVAPLSTSMDSFLRTLERTDDAIVYRADQFLFFNFPTAQQTIVLDLDIGAWYRWSSFEDGRHRNFKCRCSTVEPGQPNSWVLGSSDSNTYFLDFNAVNDDGSPIKFVFQSGHNDLGTLQRKKVTRMVAKVALDGPRYAASIFGFGKGVPTPATPEPGTRCSAYSYTFPEYPGYTLLLSGLPSGLSFNIGTRTLSGTMSCTAGTFPIIAYMIDERGARYRFSLSLVIADLDITITVTEV